MQQAESKELNQELAQQTQQKKFPRWASKKKANYRYAYQQNRLNARGVAAWKSVNQRKVFGFKPQDSNWMLWLKGL